MSLLLLSSARRGRLTPPSYQSITASLTRYDGSSGAAIFRGTIPFAPGVIATTADLDDVRVLVGGSEPSGGLWIEPLMGTHADGSIKVAYVEFSASCGSAETVTCEVRIGESRNETDRSALVDATLRTPVAWMETPTLFWVTDADYRVACRVAPLPLVTMATVQANCPAAWYNALTTEFDSRFTASVTSATQYETEYAMACRAEMTGSAVDAKNAFAQFTTRFYNDYTPGETTFSPEMNLGGGVGSEQGAANRPEWKFAGGIHLMAYYHTGHKQFQNNMELMGSFGSATTQLVNNYGVRYNLRRILSNFITGALIGQTRSFTATPGGWTYNPSSFVVTDRIDALFDVLETRADTLTVANGVPSWAEGYKLWGLSSASWAAGEHPLFQLGVAVWPLAAIYLRFVDDARIPIVLDSMRDFVDTQTYAYTNPSGLATWRHAYLPIDPTTQTLTNAGDVFLSTMFSPLYAYAYARDNTDTDAAAKADALIDERIWDKDRTTEAAPGGGGMIPAQKSVGEWVQMLPHSAAWRAGVPWNGWAIT